MATIIERSNVSPETLVDPISRYRNQVPIFYGEKKILAFETYIRDPYISTGTEKVMLITKGIEYRPDLVSYDIYGFPEAWWRILEANKMNDVFDFKAGKTIILPNGVM